MDASPGHSNLDDDNLSLPEAKRLGPPLGMTRKRMILPALTLVVLIVLPYFWESAKHSFLWLYVPLFAWALGSFLTPLAIRGAFLTGWLDIPKGRKAHAHPTPVTGGGAIIGAFGLTLLFTYSYSLEMKGVGIAALLIWIVGALDDRWELPAKLKLLVQVIAVAILIIFKVHVTFLPDTWWGMGGEWIITAMWVIGITNAVNFLDGMDGLAVGISMIIAGLLAIVSLQNNQMYFTIISLALMGACMGFLPYNFSRRRNALIFLGDNGATFLGFTLAATALVGDWAEDNVAALAVPILLFGVPIFDMTLTTIIRFGTGQVKTFGEWLAFAGRDHFHHRLAALGIGRYTSVLVIWVVTLQLGLPALALKQARGIDAFVLLSQAVLFLLILTFFMIYVRNNQIRLFVEEQKRITESGRHVRAEELEQLLVTSDKPVEDSDN